MFETTRLPFNIHLPFIVRWICSSLKISDLDKSSALAGMRGVTIFGSCKFSTKCFGRFHQIHEKKQKIQASLKEDSATPRELFWDEVTLRSKIIQVFMLLAKAMIGISYKNLLLGDLANRKAQPDTTKKHPENIVKHSTIE